LTRLQQEIGQLNFKNAGHIDEIEDLKKAVSDSYNNNNINSGNSHSYNNHLPQKGPPPEYPRLLEVPRPTRIRLQAGDVEKRENARRIAEYERLMRAYHRA